MRSGLSPTAWFRQAASEINGNASFSNVRVAEKLYEYADQVRRPTFEHRNSIPCQPVFKEIENRQDSANYFFKQLLTIGLEEVLEISSGKIFFIAVFISNVSFADIGNATRRDRSVGNVTMFSSISGSGVPMWRISSQNIKPDLKAGFKKECKWQVEPRKSQSDLNVAVKPRTRRSSRH